MKINEFSSNSPDFIELINTGTGPVDLTGWVLKDSTDNNPYTFPAGSTIAAGAIKGLSGEGVDFLFGLGGGDSVRLFSPTARADRLLRLPGPPAGRQELRALPRRHRRLRGHGRRDQGRGERVPAPAGADSIKVNEIESDPNDLVELTNIGETPGRHLRVPPQGQRRHPRLHDRGRHDPGRPRLPRGRRQPVLRPGQGRLRPAVHAGRREPARLHDVPGRHARRDLGPLPRRHRRVRRHHLDPRRGQRVRPDRPARGEDQRGRVQRRPGRRLGRAEEHSAPARSTSPAGRSSTATRRTPRPPSSSRPAPPSRPAATTRSTPRSTRARASASACGDSVDALPSRRHHRGRHDHLGPHAATTWGRCPDGTGDFRDTTTSTRGAGERLQPGPDQRDRVRRRHAGRLGGAEEHQRRPGRRLRLGVQGQRRRRRLHDPGRRPRSPADGYRVLERRRLRVRARRRRLRPAVRREQHAGRVLHLDGPRPQTYGRCKDGVGEFVDTTAPTKGAANACPGLETGRGPAARR